VHNTVTQVTRWLGCARRKETARVLDRVRSDAGPKPKWVIRLDGPPWPGGPNWAVQTEWAGELWWVSEEKLGK
jgi:hypothetical protein